MDTATLFIAFITLVLIVVNQIDSIYNSNILKFTFDKIIMGCKYIRFLFTLIRLDNEDLIKYYCTFSNIAIKAKSDNTGFIIGSNGSKYYNKSEGNIAGWEEPKNSDLIKKIQILNEFEMGKKYFMEMKAKKRKISY